MLPCAPSVRFALQLAPLVIIALATCPQNEQAELGAKCPHQSARHAGDEVALLQFPVGGGVRTRTGSVTRESVAPVKTQRAATSNGSVGKPLSNAGSSVASGRALGFLGVTAQLLWNLNIPSLNIHLGSRVSVAVAVAATVGAITLIMFAVWAWRRSNAMEAIGLQESSSRANSARGAQTTTECPRVRQGEGDASTRTPSPVDSACNSDNDSSHESDGPEVGASCGKVTFAFTCYFPLQLVFGTVVVLAILTEQMLLLPFRLCGGRVLTSVLQLFAPLNSFLYCAFVSINHGEASYGRVVESFDTVDELLNKHSASRRKNIRRNYRAAAQEFAKQKIGVSFHPAGTWRFDREIRELLWHQCLRHNERAHSYADITNCRQPVPSWLFYLGELAAALSFPCDIQLFRTPDQTLVAMNTRMHIGNAYFNPNYACSQEHSQLGIYAWSHWQILEEAIRLRATVVSFMPTMRGPKKALGLRSVSLATLVAASFSFTRAPHTEVPLETTSEAGSSPKPSTKPSPKPPCAGGKRAARKKAALARCHDNGQPGAYTEQSAGM